jgi:drug/metabolite transporter (DMT)-like permease
MTVKQKAYLALSATCLIWGTTYMVNKIGVSSIHPVLFSACRQVLSGLSILGYCFLYKKMTWPDQSYLRFQFMLGFILITIGNGIGVLGLSYIDSGLAAILAAFSPVVIAVLTTRMHPEDRLNPLGWFGVVLGFVGVYFICSHKIDWSGLDFGSNLGIALTLLSVVAWGAGSVLSKTRSFQYSPFMTSGFQMIFGSIPMVLYSAYFVELDLIEFNSAGLISFFYVVIFGSMIAYSAYIYTLKHLPAIVAGIQSYINPMIAIVLGFVFLSETLTAEMILGSTAVIAGVFLVNYSQYRKGRG